MNSYITSIHSVMTHQSKALNECLKLERHKQWQEMIEGIDLTYNSKWGWQTLSKLSGKPKQSNSYNSTADTVAHQLLLNGKPNPQCKTRIHKPKLNDNGQDSQILTLFTISEVYTTIMFLCNNKAPGLDGIHSEIIKHYGPKTRQWITDLLIDCIEKNQISTLWRNTKIVALLKHSKNRRALKVID